VTGGSLSLERVPADRSKPGYVIGSYASEKPEGAVLKNPMRRSP